MKDISKILSSLGLLDSEIKTYMAALKNGPSTVLELTKTTNLSRQAIYTAIQQLTDRSLMSSLMRGKKQYYTAESPDKLLSYAKRRQEEMNEQIKDLKSAIPELELRAGGEKPVVRMYEGKEGVKAIIEDLKTADVQEFYEIADLEAMRQILKAEDLKPLRDINIKRKRKVYALYSGEYEKTGVDTTLMSLPDNMKNFKTSMVAYGNKIALVTFAGNMHSIIIESPHLADTLRILFKLARKGA